jgi:transcription elongation factor Elf1
MSDQNKKPEYQTLNNRAMECTFCGHNVRGQVSEQTDPKTRQSQKLVRWNCDRCGQTVRIGKLAP